MKKRWRAWAALLTLAALAAALLPAGGAMAEETSSGQTMTFVYNKYYKTTVPVKIVELQMVHGQETEVPAVDFSDDLILTQDKRTTIYRVTPQETNRVTPAYSKVFAPYTCERTEALLPDGSEQVLDILTSTQTSSGPESLVKANAGLKTPYLYYRKATDKNVNTMEGLKVVLKRDLHLAYDANTAQGGAEATAQSETGILGQEIVLPDAADLGFSNADASLSFAGWNTQADGSGTAYAAGDAYVLSGQPNATTTLYAQWYQATPMTLSAETAADHLNAGDTFTVNVLLTAPAGDGTFSLCCFGLDYDADQLDLLSLSDADGNELAAQGSTYRLEAQQNANLDASGKVIAQASFRVREDAEDGAAASVQVKDADVRLGETSCPTTVAAPSIVHLHNIELQFAAVSPLQVQGTNKAYARYDEAGLYSDRYQTRCDLPQVLLEGTPAQKEGYEWQDASGTRFDPKATATQSQIVTAVPRAFLWQTDTSNAQVTDLTGVHEGQVTYGQDVTFKLAAADQEAITAVQYSIGGGPSQALNPDANGVYTIPGADIVGNVVLETVTRKDSSSSSHHRPVYQLAFNTNGGSPLEAVRHRGATTVDLTQYLPQREGYDFAGWYSDQALTKQTGKTWLLHANTTLYAAWIKQDDPTMKPQGASFDDVAPDSWYYDAVVQAAEKGLMTGTDTCLFSPDQAMTRAMFAAVLYRAQASPTPTENSRFEDVQTSDWFAPAVSWAAEEGLVRGVSAHEFAPNQIISREQMAVMLVRYGAYCGWEAPQPDDLTRFRDQADVSAWAREDVTQAVAAGYLRGVQEDLLAPGAPLSRAQAAAALLRTGFFA